MSRVRLLLSPRQTLEDTAPDLPEIVPVQPGDIVVQRQDDGFHVYRHEPDVAEGETGILIFQSLEAARAAAEEACRAAEAAEDAARKSHRADREAAIGMVWFNAQSEAARIFWLDRAGPGASAADAWQVFKQHRGHREATVMSPSKTIAKICESLAQIRTIAVLLSGTEPTEADRTAGLRLIEAQAECATLRLEQLERLEQETRP